MSRRPPRVAATRGKVRWRRRVIWLLVAAGVTAYLVQRPSIAELRAQRARLRERWSALAAKDALLGQAPDADLALGVPAAYTQQLAERAAGYLLESVPLTLKDIRFHREGAVDKKLLFSGVRLGRWRLDVRIRSLTGVVRGRTPQLRLGSDGLIAVSVPVVLEQGHAAGALRFAWDSAGVANVLCRDFNLGVSVEASVVSDPHALDGQLRLEIDEPTGTLSATAALDAQTLRVRIEPSAETWARLRRGLEAQDTFWHCGIALRPDDVIERLRELARSGFPVRLPPRELRPLRVPASFRLSLGVPTPIQLSASPVSLRVTPTMLWYGARVDVRALDESAASGVP